MSTPLLTVCIVNYNSSDFIELTLYALKQLTKNPYKVIITDNNSRASDVRKLKEIIRTYDAVTLYESNTDLKGSMAHGTALNELVQKIDTTYGVILDADATFLVQGWDQLLIDRITDTVPIYGTQADKGGGKPEDFPLMFAMLCTTKVLQSLTIDFRPNDLQKYQDTGWELREKYRAAGYEGALLYSFSTRTHTHGPFGGVICTEYYQTPDASGPIIASHFGRGSAPTAKKLVGVRGTSLPARLLNKLLTYVTILKWKRDKKVWLAICRSLIDSPYGTKN